MNRCHPMLPAWAETRTARLGWKPLERLELEPGPGRPGRARHRRCRGGGINATTWLALTMWIAAVISRCEREISEVNRSIRLLEKGMTGAA